MSRTREVGDGAAPGSLTWLGTAVAAVVLLILVAVIWGLYTVASIDSGPPRTAVESRVRMLEGAVQQNPSSDQAWADYIRVLSESGEHGDAKAAISDADEALGSRKGKVGVEEARLSLLQDDLDEALEQADAAIVLVRQEAEAETADRAARGVVQAADAAPEIEALIVRGTIHAKRGELEAAADDYGAALALDPTMSDIFVERGLLYAELGRTDEAQADFEQALVFIPDYDRALEGLEQIGR